MVLSVQGDEGKPNGNTVQSWTLCINTRRCIKIHVDSQWVKQCPKFSSKASTVPELRTFRCSSWIQKQKRSQRSSCQHLLYRQKSKRVPEKHLLLLYDYTKAFDSVDHNKLWKILKDGNSRPPDLPPEKSVYRSRSNRQNWTWNSSLVPNWERST